MLTYVSRTNLAQKHLGELLQLWQSSPESTKYTLEISFTLLMNRALGSILLEVITPLSGIEQILEDDVLTLLSRVELTDSVDQSVIQTRNSLSNPQHWLCHWHTCWQSMLVIPSNQKDSIESSIITSTAVPRCIPDIATWYQNFNELVVNLRTQNEYC